MLMRDKVVEVARQYLGYNEADGTDDAIIDKYNAIRPSGGYMMNHEDAWCAAFVSVVFNEAGCGDLVSPNCKCDGLITQFRDKGCWQEDGTVVPQKGDVILYNWDSSVQPNNGSADHVGIVTGVNSSYIYVIEGNYSDSVKERIIAIGNGYIRGFGLPHYGDVQASSEYKPTAILRVGSRGSDVQWLQRKLGVDDDGIFGPITRQAVINFQSAHGLMVDGVVGPQTYGAL